jgi:hypothetical protein
LPGLILTKKSPQKMLPIKASPEKQRHPGFVGKSANNIGAAPLKRNPFIFQLHSNHFPKS